MNNDFDIFDAKMARTVTTSLREAGITPARRQILEDIRQTAEHGETNLNLAFRVYPIVGSIDGTVEHPVTEDDYVFLESLGYRVARPQRHTDRPEGNVSYEIRYENPDGTTVPNDGLYRLTTTMGTIQVFWTMAKVSWGDETN